MIRTIQEDLVNQYIGINLKSNLTEGQSALINFNKTEVILHNPSQYYAYIRTFNIPVNTIPLLEFQTFTFTLTYDGASVSKNASWIPGSTDVAPGFSQPVYQHTMLIQSFNKALEDAYQDLKVLKPLMPVTTAPKIGLDSSTSLLSMYTEIGYESSLANPINILISKSVLKRLSSLRYSEVSANSFQLLVIDQMINGVVYKGNPAFKMTGEFLQIQNWNDFSTLAFETSYIPVQSTLIGDQSNVQRNILDDFIIVDRVPNNDNVVFNVTGSFLPQSLISNYPWSRVDLNIVFFNPETNTTFPILIKEGDSATITIGIKKKINDYLEELNEEGLNF